MVVRVMALATTANANAFRASPTMTAPSVSICLSVIPHTTRRRAYACTKCQCPTHEHHLVAAASDHNLPSRRVCPGVCPSDCSNNGFCYNATCHCHPGWRGLDCSLRSCPAECNYHGTCKAGKCICRPGWKGEDCAIRACPNDCSGHGTCMRSACQLSLAGCCFVLALFPPHHRHRHPALRPLSILISCARLSPNTL